MNLVPQKKQITYAQCWFYYGGFNITLKQYFTYLII